MDRLKIAGALLLSSLVPLTGVAVVGLGAGYHSPPNLIGFVLVWALFVCPLTFAVALSAYLLCPRFGLDTRRHSVVGGFLLGSLLVGGWFMQANLVGGALFGLAGGAIGAATGLTFWKLAFRSIPPRPRSP